MKTRKLAVRLAVMMGITVLTIGLLSIQPATAQSNTNTITVTGVGLASGSANIAAIQLGFEVVNTNLSTALSKATDTTAAITQAIVKLSVDNADIQTVNITISPEDRLAGGSPTGTYIYRVRNTMRVTLRDLTKLSQLVPTAVGAGADFIDSINFGISDISSLEETARVMAIRNARDRADELAQGLGIGVGDPIIVTENIVGNNFPAVLPGSGAAGLVSSPDRIPTTIGQLVVAVQVQVTYAIRTQR